MNIRFKRFFTLLAGFVVFLSFNVAAAHSATTLHTDLKAWESLAVGGELFQTTAENIAKADEVSSIPGSNTKVGPLLTFQRANTGLSSGFQVESLQAQGTNDINAGFTFNDTEGGVPLPEYNNALSVGDYNDREDDDWRFSLLDGSYMTAFGVELRDVYFESGEWIKLYSGDALMDTVDLGYLRTPNEIPSFFLGLTTNYKFDRIVFNESTDTGDDIGLADFRFVTAKDSSITTPVAPEPISSILFIVGGATLGFRRFWNKKV